MVLGLGILHEQLEIFPSKRNDIIIKGLGVRI